MPPSALRFLRATGLGLALLRFAQDLSAQPVVVDCG